MSQPSTASEAGATAVAKGGDKPRKRALADGPVEVTLQHGRWRHFGWAVFGLLVGVVFVWKFGAVAKFLGAALLLVAGLNLARFAQTFLFQPGTFRITADQMLVPPGLCRGQALELAVEQLHHVFFLRKAVPWTRAGPILVIEAKGRVFSYPRDWFASDSDQRRVALALNRKLKRL